MFSLKYIKYGTFLMVSICEPCQDLDISINPSVSTDSYHYLVITAQAIISQAQITKYARQQSWRTLNELKFTHVDYLLTHDLLLLARRKAGVIPAGTGNSTWLLSTST